MHTHKDVTVLEKTRSTVKRFPSWKALGDGGMKPAYLAFTMLTSLLEL